MIVAVCPHEKCRKYGKDRKGRQRLKCRDCGKILVNDTPNPLGTMRIELADAATCLSLLLEGMSIRACERITGLHRDTICDLIVVVGENCERFLNRAIRDTPVEDVQCDELWAFVGMKEKLRMALDRTPDFGDAWTCVAIERNTKLVLAYQIGQRRDYYTIRTFLQKLNNATTGHFQISTDGLNQYRDLVPFTFGSRCDFGQLIKSFRQMQSTIRYSPGTIIASEKRKIYGDPDEDKICTSHIERFNLTVRMQVRRFTRLTNAHSKSLKHHTAMLAIFFAWYNFCRKHETVRATPAQASGLADRQWTVGELIERAAMQ